MGYRTALVVAIAVILASACSGAESTDVEPLEFDDSSLLSDRDLALAIQQCLVARGFEAEFSESALSGPIVRIPPQPNAEAEALLDAARADCNDELIADGLMRPAMLPSEDEMRDQYAHLVEMRDCLIDLGFEIDPPPVEGSYLAEGGVWLPHNDLDAQVTDLEVLENAYQVCPQIPTRN